MRMKSKWYKKDKTRSLEETASALGFICWQIAVERVKNMERWQYYVDLPDRTLNIIAEFLIFMAHITDRVTFDQFDQAERAIFLNALVKRLAEILQDNWQDVGDSSRSSETFITLVNQRFSDYSGFTFNSGEPSFDALRYLAKHIVDCVGDDHKKGVMEQIMEVEGLECWYFLQKGLKNLMGLT